MLKGRSTIQLFDAATGKKLLEQSDTNMVTDALDIIANMRDKTGLFRWWERKISVSNILVSDRIKVSPFRAMLPLYKKALGGLLMWDSAIPENPSQVIPPPGVYEVGHAGEPYSGTDIYKGSYNENESGEISGGYRHVWDFDTDKANGTIKCLSLTSRHGGSIGYHGCFEGDTNSLFTFFYFHEGDRADESATGNNGIFWEGDENGAFLYIRSMGDGSLRIYKKSNTSIWYSDLPDPNKIPLLSDGLRLSGKVMLPITLTKSACSVYVYQGQIHELALTALNKLIHRVFDLDGEEISKNELDLKFSYRDINSKIPAVYRGGYYYCIPRTDMDIVKLDKEGNEVGRIPLLKETNDDIYGVMINEYNNEIILCLRPYTGGGISYYTATVINARDEISKRSGGARPDVVHDTATSYIGAYPQYVKTDDSDSMFVYYADLNGGVTPLLNSGYLATINNLQMPITKTSAQTMKITYEIYDE